VGGWAGAAVEVEAVKGNLSAVVSLGPTLAMVTPSPVQQAQPGRYQPITSVVC
jgi:hypothetical protein